MTSIISAPQIPADVESGPSAADRIFEVLETCARAGRPLTLAQLVERTGLPKSTLHRACWKLVALGALDDTGHGFRIGTRLFALASAHPDLRRLRAASMPYLHVLCARTGWIANLATRSGDRALLLEEQYLTPHGTAKMLGSTLPLHATAVGKALLAYAPPEEIEATIARTGLRAYTGHTIVRPQLLLEHLQTIRTRGYALSCEEWHIGAAGVAAPVVVDGDVVASVALVGPPDQAELRRLAAPVQLAAARLARALAPRAAEPTAA
jgi:DNA-binding IclR family transcriptional regulator